MIKVFHVVGARPNFMKAAPILRAMSARSGQFDQTLVHTGQHYDSRMSGVFFDELEMPRPDVNLAVGSGSHAWQTAQVMLRFEALVQERLPDLVLVPGDVNSTLACALVCSKLGVRVAHVEAGLRSFDRRMPEEVNRVVTDHISDLLFTPSPDAGDNLLREGIPPEKIKFVGNVMIDTLMRLLPKAAPRWASLRSEHALPERFILVTLHRPSNVDDVDTLSSILEALKQLSREAVVLFPVHPRTRERMNAQWTTGCNIRVVEPLGYLDFLALQMHAALVVTDSGGIQEETTYLGTPCLTLRENTERPVTITHGTNRLVPEGVKGLVPLARTILEHGRASHSSPPEYWDGKTAERIVDCVLMDAGLP